ncbi:MAG TPA: type VI secretion system tube protein Hcp [Desulfobacteraceae bacterium]|jgi:type VI secretion system secreted protein Hcp|nr:type VI secretion system tube protein Hcp [Desulfobacteraceae bacterium]
MATNMYLQLDGIKGESVDLNHKDWIEILSFSHGFTQPVTPVRASSGSTVERCNHSDISVSKYVDKATDAILKHIWSGKQISKAVLEFFRADGQNKPVKYIEVELANVVISNYNMSGGQGSLPMENISLSYGKVTYRYTQYDVLGKAGGVQPVYHDLTKNEVG